MIKFKIRVPYKMGTTKEVVDILNINNQISYVEDDHVTMQLDDGSPNETTLDVRLLEIEQKWR